MFKKKKVVTSFTYSQHNLCLLPRLKINNSFLVSFSNFFGLKWRTSECKRNTGTNWERREENKWIVVKVAKNEKKGEIWKEAKNILKNWPKKKSHLNSRYFQLWGQTFRTFIKSVLPADCFYWLILYNKQPEPQALEIKHQHEPEAIDNGIKHVLRKGLLTNTQIFVFGPGAEQQTVGGINFLFWPEWSRPLRENKSWPQITLETCPGVPQHLPLPPPQTESRRSVDIMSSHNDFHLSLIRSLNLKG